VRSACPMVPGRRSTVRPGRTSGSVSEVRLTD